MTDPELEAMARAHCDYFGGKGWWDTGLIADTKPKAFEAMGLARQALDAHRIARAGELMGELSYAENRPRRIKLHSDAAASITSLEAEVARLREVCAFIADLPDPGEEKERTATFYRIHLGFVKQVAAKAIGRKVVSDEAMAWAVEWVESEEGRQALKGPTHD